MTEPGEADETTLAEDAGPRGGPSRRLILGGCLAAALLVAGAAAALYWGWSASTGDVTRAAEQFLDLVDAARYDEAYREAGEELRSANSEEEFATIFARIFVALGRRRSLECTRVTVGATLGGGGQAFVTFLGAYDLGDARVDVQLRKYGGRWRVVGVNYQSDALLPP
jgi:hypothetical protein